MATLKKKKSDGSYKIVASTKSENSENLKKGATGRIVSAGGNVSLSDRNFKVTSSKNVATVAGAKNAPATGTTNAIVERYTPRNVPLSPVAQMEQDKQEARKQEFNQYLDRLRDSAYLEQVQSYTRNSDYADLSKAADGQRSLFGRDKTYDYINDIGNARAAADLQFSAGGAQNPYAGYLEMTDDEIGIYNYLYAKNGKEDADFFLEYITKNPDYKNLNMRMAETSMERRGDSTALDILTGVPAGFNQFGTGLIQSVTNKPQGTTFEQYSGQMARENLEDVGPKILGSSLGQAAYDVVQTTSNMVPAIAFSAAAGLAGAPAAAAGLASSSILGASAGGNAYNQKIMEGYSPEQARLYSTLIGVSEGGLQYALGGIGALGGTSSKIASKVSGIENGIARFALRMGGSMASEGLEEGLQEAIEPIISSAVFSEEYEPAKISDIVYAGLLGALSAGFMEGPGVAIDSFSPPSRPVADPSLYTENTDYSDTYGDQDPFSTAGRYAESGSYATQDSYVSDAGTVAEDILKMAADDMAQRGRVTNRTAEAALRDAETASSLRADFGMNIEDGMSNAQRRAAVKSALESISQQRNEQTTKDSVRTETKSSTTDSVEGIANTLGKNGKKAMLSMYDGRVPKVDYADDFLRAYNAGLNGAERPAARFIRNSEFSAAYFAGVNDAAENTIRDIKRTGNGKVTAAPVSPAYAKKSGFVKNEYSSGVSGRMERIYDGLAKKTGIRISVAAPTGKNGANGWYKNGNVYIAADAENPGIVVAKHEVTHRLQEIAPEEYMAYREYAVNSISETYGSADPIIDRYISRYKESGVELTREEAMDEIAADFTEAILTDEKKFERLVSDNRTVAQRVLDAIKDFIHKVKSVLSRQSDRDAAARETFGMDLATLEEAERLWTKALEKGYDTVRAAQNLATEEVEAEVNTKFSMKAPMEATDRLIALHNMSEDALRGAVELGGFAMPSIAVTRAEIGHKGFGDISLVFGRDTISPTDRRNMIFSGDAYTPTFPEIGYKVSESVAISMREKIRNLIGGESWAKDIRVSLDIDNLTDKLRRSRGDFEEAYGREDALRIAFLKDTGRSIRVPMREKTYTQNTDINGLRELNKKLDIREILNSDHQEVMSHEPEVREIVRNRAIEKYGDEIANQLYPADKALSFSNVHNLIMAASRFSHDGTTREVDSVALSQRLRKIFSSKKTAAEYSSWLENFSKGIIEKRGVRNSRDFYTASGNRRSFEQLYYDYTLSNIVKAMQSEVKQGAGGFITGSGNIRGASARTYSSIEDARADIGRIQELSDDAKDAAYEAFDQKCFELCMDLVRGKDDRAFAAIDAAEVLTETLAKYKTEDSIYRYLKREYDGIYNVSREIARDAYNLMKEAQQLPVTYFEAKPYREVGFDEVLAVVAPSNMDKSLKQDLQDMGVLVKSYKPNDEADRLKKVNSVEGARFSLKSKDSQGRELTPEQKEFFKDSKVLDENGNLLVMYHGTPNAGFTKFRSGSYFTQNREYAEVYKNPSASSISRGKIAENPDVYAVYLNITKPFDTRNEAERQIFYDEYYRQWGMGTDLQESGLPDWLDGGDLQEFLEENGYDYDGLILDEGGVGGYGEEVQSRGISYVTFSPEQVKNVDNISPTEDPDIRRSTKGDSILKENAALREENALLRDRVDYWKGQTKRTKSITTDKKSVEKAARVLIRFYSSDLTKEDITRDLQNLYDYIASGKDGDSDLTYTEVRSRADAIANKLIESASVKDDEIYQQYKDLRSFFRENKIVVSEDDVANITDYADFRKRNTGRMILAKGNSNIDQIFFEASYRWPEFFDEEKYRNPYDQLYRIAEVLDGIYRIEERNPYGDYMQDAIVSASNEIIDLFFDLPQTRKTFADRKAAQLSETKAKSQQQLQRMREKNDARIAELRKKSKERLESAVQKERQKRADQIDKLKTRYAEKDAAGRERRSARELRSKIIRHANDLSQKLLRPSDKNHIPEGLRNAVASMLASINLESAYTLDPETVREVRRRDGKSGGMTGKRLAANEERGVLTKRTEAFRQLRLAYQEITKEGSNYSIVLDPDLIDNLDKLESMRNTPISSMNSEQLQTVWATIRAVEASIRSENKLLAKSKFETVAALADSIRAENMEKTEKKNYSGLVGKVQGLLTLDMMAPETFFHILGDGGDTMFRMMRNAADEQTRTLKESEDFTKNLLDGMDARFLEKEMHTFHVGGRDIEMSTAQVMELYVLSKREQAKDHIYVGGIRPTGAKKGIVEVGAVDPVKVTPEELADIVDTLTPEQKKVAEGMQEYLSNEMSEKGNQASMRVYGYRKFNEKFYWPIRVDSNQVATDVAKDAVEKTVPQYGMTKQVTPNANNALFIGSIFDSYAKHITEMAIYSAWLPTWEDVNRVHNFQFRNQEGQRTGTVKAVVQKVFGKNGDAYITNLLRDVSQGTKASADTIFSIRGLTSAYKAAAVGANLRVILQQPTAGLRALDLIDQKYFLKGMARKGDWEKVKKWAPIAQWKDWGYFEMDTGRAIKDVLLGSDSLLEKTKQVTMSAAGKADSITWARIWNACEEEILDKRPNLKKGSDEFYQAVAERFTQVIYQTQVVDSVLNRTQIMRSSSDLNKMAASFMSEPSKVYNMFLRSVYDLRSARPENRDAARRRLGRTTFSLVASFAVNAVAQSLVDGLRDDDREKKYWDKFSDAYVKNFSANFNPAGYVPYLRDLVSIVQGYDVSRMDMDSFAKVTEAATAAYKALMGNGKKTIQSAFAGLFFEAARLFGVPVSNVKRDVLAVITTTASETDNYLLQYRIDKATLNIGYSGNKGRFMDILYNASVNDREAYEIIYDDMVKNGIPEKDIVKAMENRMKEAHGVKNAEDLEKRYLTPEQEKKYNSIYRQVSGSSVWNSANQEQRASVEKDIYNLITEKDAGEELREKIEDGFQYGISDVDYILYRAAREIANDQNPDQEKRNKSIDQDEAETAVNMLTGLSDEAKAYLWQSNNKSWKEENNPFK